MARKVKVTAPVIFRSLPETKKKSAIRKRRSREVWSTSEFQDEQTQEIHPVKLATDISYCIEKKVAVK
jgi:hypothetical protein